jgi:DNA-directed RNA polymerase specialized sigma24 family protein
MAPPRLFKRIGIQAALERLPKLRETLVLAVHQGLATTKSQPFLHVPLGNVKSRVFNALATWKKMYVWNSPDPYHSFGPA